jgi:hypothetical protein
MDEAATDLANCHIILNFVNMSDAMTHYRGRRSQALPLTPNS